MRMRSAAGQTPEQVVAACVRQARRHVGLPASRVAIMESLAPFTAGLGHGDINGAHMADTLHRWASSFTFYREPAGFTPGGAPRAGEVISSAPLTIRLNGGDCDDFAALIATAAATFGCAAAVGYYHPDGRPEFAHIVAAIRPGWYDGGPWVVVDPQVEGPRPAASYPSVRWVAV